MICRRHKARKLSPREPFVSIVRTCSARGLRGCAAGPFRRVRYNTRLWRNGPSMMLMMSGVLGEGSVHDAVTCFKPQAGNLSASAFFAPVGGLTSPHLTGRQKEIFRQSGVQHELAFQTSLAAGSSRFGGQGFAHSTSQNHHSFLLGLGHEPSASGEL